MLYRLYRMSWHLPRLLRLPRVLLLLWLLRLLPLWSESAAAAQGLQLLLGFKPRPGLLQVVCMALGRPFARVPSWWCRLVLKVATQPLQLLPALATAFHQLIEMLLSALGQVCRAGCAGPLHPLVPAANLIGQAQQLGPQAFGLLPPLLGMPLTGLTLLLLLLVPQPALLGGVGAQESIQLLLQPGLQLLPPA